VTYLRSVCLAATVCLVAAPASARNLLDIATMAVAIDADGYVSFSDYPEGENPNLALDGDPNTKYLNFAGIGTGIIIPGTAPTVAQSLQILTANDAPERDPFSFNVYGTDDPITSADNSTGSEENWSLISSGFFFQDSTRFTLLPPVNLGNSTPYTNYRVEFPELSDNNAIFQAAEIGLYEGLDGVAGGSNRIIGSPALAINNKWDSRYPGAEGPEYLVDGASDTKYLNFGKANSGVIFTPSVPGSVDAMVLTTANDSYERDPASYELYGTDDPIVSENNSDGNGESWTLISSGALDLPTTRFAATGIAVGSSDTYSSYKIVFPTLRDENAANSMQIADIQLLTAAERLSWAADGTAAGGSGSWSEFGSTWVGDGGFAEPLSAGSQAVFNGPGGTVTVDSAVTVEAGISFESDGYRLTDGTVTLAGPASLLNTISVANSLTATVDSALAGTDGMTKTGGGTLVLGGASTLTGRTLVSAGTLEVASSAAVGGSSVTVAPGGTLAIASGVSLQVPSVVLDGGALSATAVNLDLNGGIENLTVRPGGELVGAPAATITGGGRLALPTDARVTVAVGSLTVDEVGGRGLLGPSSTSLAIDTDGFVSRSDYPAGEFPDLALDADVNSKYLNFGGQGSGIIIPGFSPTLVQSIQVTTANDAPGRDPTSFVVYGTEDLIISADNSTGNAEAWTEIGSGTFSTDDGRFVALPAVNLTNSTSYTSYRVDFPEQRDNNEIFQVAEIGLYEGTDATGNRIFGSPALAINNRLDSRYPGGEGPANLLDGSADSKYLNFGKENTGVIVTPVTTGSVLSMVITTANDFPERDPASYELYGTNGSILSGDNSDGTAEAWTLISSGPLNLPEDRLTNVTVDVGATESYASYKVVFPTLRDAGAANSMQVAGLQFFEAARGGAIDLGAGAITVAAGGISAEDLRADIIAGLNGGTWDGVNGITSSLAASSAGTRAVGYVANADGSAVVSFAAPGDTDLNGQVNVFDLVGIDAAGTFGTGAASDWSGGDFNYDGVTNVFDLIGIDSSGAYGSGNYFPGDPSTAGLGSVAVVPEPTSWLLLAACGGLAAACRRRQRGPRPVTAADGT
jgi:autotransporter-associated beta strand protein